MAASLVRLTAAQRVALAALLAGLLAVGVAPIPASDPAPRASAERKAKAKGPFDLIFDVGAPITLLTNRAALDSGTIKADAPRSFLFSIRGESQVETLEVGELTARDLPVIVLDHPLLKAMGD